MGDVVAMRVDGKGMTQIVALESPGKLVAKNDANTIVHSASVNNITVQAKTSGSIAGSFSGTYATIGGVNFRGPFQMNVETDGSVTGSGTDFDGSFIFSGTIDNSGSVAIKTNITNSSQQLNGSITFQDNSATGQITGSDGFTSNVTATKQ